MYEKTRDFAEGLEILIADTKMEFGIKDGKRLVIGELLTPGSISMTIDGRSYAKEC
jgi:phosphoribosylaminoimidazole-succinocarboxamide synthase